jgi:hypothetical protein
MTPVLIDNGDPENLNTNLHIFSRGGEYYLAYVAEKGQKIQINLPGDRRYTADLIDTWNMKITPLEGEYTGSSEFTLPDQPYMALRIRKN